MAEALLTTKARRSNAISTTYLETPAEIARVLKSLRNQRTQLKLTFEGSSTLYSARILDVLNDELLLEDLVPRSALKLMTERRPFSFSGRSQGVYLFSRENRISAIDEDRGVPYFRVPLPVSVLYQQRRRAPRYQVPLRVADTLTSATLFRDIKAEQDHPEVLAGQLLDISAGGCRVAIDGPVHPPLAADEVLSSCAIAIPHKFDLSAQAEIRHAAYNKRTGKVICGLEFTSMHITDLRRLEQFLQSLAKLSEQG